MTDKTYKLVKFDMDDQTLNLVKENMEGVSSFINGHVELIRKPNTTLGVLCNEDGMRSNLPPFIIKIKGEAPFRVFGNFFITKLNNNGNFINISENEITSIRVMPDLLFYYSGPYEITEESIKRVENMLRKSDKKTS